MHYSKTPLSLERAVQLAPALASPGPHGRTSSAYEYIPTTAVLAALQGEGFAIHGVQQARVRQDDRNGFQKHMVRLRRSDSLRNVGDEAPELIITNSHDGSSAYNLLAGLMRLICTNGCVVGESWGNLRIKHKGGQTISDVIEGTYQVLDTFGAVTDSVEQLKQITLDKDEQEVLAKSAFALRYGDEERAPVTPLALLTSRRPEDKGNDLWRTFNRLQENLTKGGLQGRRFDEAGKLKKTRLKGINGIDGNLALNRALWTLTEQMAALKGQPLSKPQRALDAS